jgi:hypothetical protein
VEEEGARWAFLRWLFVCTLLRMCVIVQKRAPGEIGLGGFNVGGWTAVVFCDLFSPALGGCVALAWIRGQGLGGGVDGWIRLDQVIR